MNKLAFVVFALVVTAPSCSKESPARPGPTGPSQPPSPPTPPVQVASRVEITPSSVSLHSIGQTQQLTARVLDRNNTPIPGVPLVWSSGNVRVVSVDSRVGLVSARGNGKTRITAQTLTQSASIEVTVMQSAASIKVEPSRATLTAIDARLRVVATVLDRNENPIEDAPVSWSSSEEAVATVNAQGLVIAIAGGTAEITAQSGEIQANVDISVMQVASIIAIEPGEARVVPVGEVIELAVTVLDGNEHPIVDAVVDWSSSDETVATVDQRGLVTAVGEGSARIIASSGDAEQMTIVLVSTTEAGPELEALIALYNATDGNNWSDNTNWLSAVPLETWHGLAVDFDGRIIWVTLPDNQLTGHIPPELGQLSRLTWLNLYQNQLSGEIPAELGQLENLESLSLSFNQLSGEIPAELGQLKSLKLLHSRNNQLSGEIPSELGRLENLELLDLRNNRLTGGIPSELGQLSQLTWLDLGVNELTGAIPSDLGRLRKLGTLSLNANSLTGEIPSELGQLESLETMQFFGNRLTGGIPNELGQLSHLTFLSIGANDLTGTIPSELGQLEQLEFLLLQYNGLMGEIPAELGQFKNLVILYFQNNQLTGVLPESLGSLTSLKNLDLSYNGGLTGAIPKTLTGLMLEELRLDLTRLCEPEDAEIWDWLNTIPTVKVHTCSEVFLVRKQALLTQVIQNLDSTVPLVAGEDALLRVFISAPTDMDTPMPPVTARFFVNGAEVYRENIPVAGKHVPSVIEVGDLEATVNVTIPGYVIEPGLEMVVEIDPDGISDEALRISGRLPAAGRTPVRVTEVPLFRLTVVPLVWTENPDEMLLAEVNALTAGSEIFHPTQDYLPIQEFDLDVRSPVFISEEPVSTDPFLNFVKMIRTMDGEDRHYLGIVYRGGGKAVRPGLDTVSELNGFYIGHELGHNLSLGHAPCGSPTGIDLDFPYPDGNIGAWGYDHRNAALVPPFVSDHMSYCGPPDWTSDYNFRKAMNNRLSRADGRRTAKAFSSTGKSLLIWGGIDEYGELYLEPSFVIDAPPSMPSGRGLYEIAGEDANGNALFEMSFSMDEIVCGEGESEGGGFVFALPVRADWSGRLEQIELSGPEGYKAMTKDGGPSAALLLDENTGEFRGLLRDWPEPGSSLRAARRTLPEPGLEMIVSPGIPDAADWER